MLTWPKGSNCSCMRNRGRGKGRGERRHILVRQVSGALKQLEARAKTSKERSHQIRGG